MLPPVAVTYVLSMRGCEALDKGVALAVETRGFPSHPCVQEGQEISAVKADSWLATQTVDTASGATVLIVKGAWYLFLALHLLGLPWRPMLQHGVENCQELVHTRCQGAFFDFSCGKEPLVKHFNLRVETRRYECTHVK